MEPTVTSSSNDSIKKGIIFLLIAAIVLAVFFILSGDKVEEEVSDSQVTTKENVVVTKTNLAAAQAVGKLPAGFPDGVPVDTSDVYESYSMSYPERGMVLYSVGFNSDLTVDDNYTSYLKYMNDAGYSFADNGRVNSGARASLYGTKDSKDLSVVITSQGNKTTIHLNYLDRTTI